MTREEYLETLKAKLESFSKELQKEILEDYEQHFQEGLLAGKTEEEIIEELGSIEDMVQELPEEDMMQEIIPSESEPFHGGSYEGGYDAIIIDGLSADVSVEASEDGRIYVDYRNDGDEEAQKRYRFYQYEENNIFYAGVKDMGASRNRKELVLFGRTIPFYTGTVYHHTNIKLKVRVPGGIPRLQVGTISGDISGNGIRAEQVKLGTSSGDMELEDIACEKMVIQASSGDIELMGIKAESVSMQTGSGDIDGNRLAVETLTVGTGSGDVQICGAVVECTVKTGSGDVELQTESNAKKVGVATGSGDVHLDLKALGNAEVHAATGSGDCVVYGADGSKHHISGASRTIGSGECKVNVRTGSGDAEIMLK